MVNNIEFADRLKKVMSFYGMTATAFADSIEIQRSSISHLLSGRNKPSLDFVLRVLQKYPKVELYWLLNGKGKFPIEENIEAPAPLLNNSNDEIIQKASNAENNEEIDKIVIFYKNGTFKSYKP